MTCVAKFVFACTLYYITGMKDKIKKISLFVGGMMMVGLSYMIMMGTMPFGSVESEMFGFLISGIGGITMTGLVFTK